MHFIDLKCFLAIKLKICSIFIIPNETKVKHRFPQIYHKLKLMNFATNLPEQPTFNDSKFKQTLRENLKFIKGLFYLTKKIFML